MTIKIFTDRSRIVERERCDRKRWLVYHESGTGIVPRRTPLALGVGSAVHAGQAVLVWEGNTLYTLDPRIFDHADGMAKLRQLEDKAVATALADFSSHAAGLELDANENAGLTAGQTPEAKQLAESMIAQARELGMAESDIAGITAGADPAVARSEFERYLFAEQSALVEGLVRAYCRRRLRPLLEEFEVLEVEREGEWKLSQWQPEGEWVRAECSKKCAQWLGSTFDSAHPWPDKCPGCGAPTVTSNNAMELYFMSRPDALLRHRQTNELYLLSYKTTGQWDTRKAKDIEHDMQGLSEGVEVEKRLGAAWQAMNVPNRTEGPSMIMAEFNLNYPVHQYLARLNAPPRIHAIRYEFLLKGERWKDKELSSRLGIEARSQKSHLIQQYVATSTPKKGDGGYSVGDVAWSWDFYRPEDDKDSKLAWQNWKSRPIFVDVSDLSTQGGHPYMREWIDQLDQSELLMSGEDSTIGLAPRTLGWKSPAQAMGVTKDHPLDKVFTVIGADGRPTQAITIYRNDDDLRDWIDTVAHEERETAQRVAEVNAAGDPGERRHLLNIYFPKRRSSCQYPSECPYAREKTGVCFAGAEMQAAPLEVGGGEYVRRVPNHPQELVTIK